MTDVVDSTATEVEPEPNGSSQAIVPVVPTLAVTPQVEAAELVARLDVIKEAMRDAMTEGVDYGHVPGTDKPALFKPGAEKLNVLFQLDIQMVNEKTWGPGDHLTVVSKATVFHAPTGARLGSGEGICSTREKKYAYRKAERVCPHCNEPAVIKGRAEYGGGWLCFRRKGGCGAKWQDGDQVIEGHEVGQVDNPDLPDQWNVCVKMAAKRARVDAVLAVTGASALFTQDMEDQAPPDDPGSDTPPASETVQRIDEAQRRAQALPAELVNEMAKQATALVKAEVWTPEKLKTHLVAAGATDTSSSKKAISSLTPASADELRNAMADLLAAHENGGGS